MIFPKTPPPEAPKLAEKTGPCSLRSLKGHRGIPCTDPESFVRGGQNLITLFLVDEGIEDPNTAINLP